MSRSKECLTADQGPADNGDGRENVAEKVNSRSFNLHRDYSQARIYNGFHRFTEIRQILRIINIFLIFKKIFLR